jgi:hypothetical protein
MTSIEVLYMCIRRKTGIIAIMGMLVVSCPLSLSNRIMVHCIGKVSSAGGEVLDLLFIA